MRRAVLSIMFGRYRPHGTDLKRGIVLVTPERVVVVTPADPDASLQHIQMLFPGIQGRGR